MLILLSQTKNCSCDVDAGFHLECLKTWIEDKKRHLIARATEDHTGLTNCFVSTSYDNNCMKCIRNSYTACINLKIRTRRKRVLTTKVIIVSRLRIERSPVQFPPKTNFSIMIFQSWLKNFNHDWKIMIEKFVLGGNWTGDDEYAVTHIESVCPTQRLKRFLFYFSKWMVMTNHRIIKNNYIHKIMYRFDHRFPFSNT